MQSQPHAWYNTRGVLAAIATAFVLMTVSCASTSPMAEQAIKADSAIVSARTQVVLTGVGVAVSAAPGEPATMSAVQPVTCIRLPNGDLLTAAHTLPNGHLGAVRVRIDESTGQRTLDRSSSIATNGPPFVLILDDAVTMARVSASETLRYASAGVASRQSVPVDWAIITPNNARRSQTPITQIATPKVGETCFMIGYPRSLMADELFEAPNGVVKATELPWLRAPGVIIPGTITGVDNDSISITTEHLLGARGRGLSGGGVFVRRNGKPALVAVAVQASRSAPIITACPLPTEVTRRFQSP